MSLLIERILIVGSGSIGQKHAQALVALFPKITLIWLRQKITGELEKAFLGSVEVDTIEAAKNLDPQGVIIATPAHLRLDYLNAFWAKGLPCYVEKPLCLTMAECAQIEALAKTTQAFLMVGCNLRWLPSLRLLKQQIEISTARLIRASFFVGQWLPSWRPNRDYTSVYSAMPHLGGGVIFDLIHEFDLVYWLLGNPTLKACIAGHFSDLTIQSEDTAVSLMSVNGKPVSVHQDYVSRVPYRKIEIITDQGHYEWDLLKKCLSWHDESGKTVMTDANEAFQTQETYRCAMFDFTQGIAKNLASNPSPLTDALKVTRLAIEAREMAGLLPV
jgi:predicted dehydrogenase